MNAKSHKSECFFDLERKDYITSLDAKENLILLSSFNKLIYIYEINNKSSSLSENSEKAKLLKKMQFDFPILHSKLLKIENKIHILFCGLHFKFEIDSNALLAFELEKNLNSDKIEFERISDFDDLITKFTLIDLDFNSISYNNNDSESNKGKFLLAQSENTGCFYLYKVNFNAGENKNKAMGLLTAEISERINFVFLEKLNLEFLSYSHFSLIEKQKLLVIAGIDNRESPSLQHKGLENAEAQEEQNNNSEEIKCSNVIFVFSLAEKVFNFLKEIKSPLNQITNCIANLNDAGFVIGSLNGKIGTFSDLALEETSANELEVNFKELSFKAHKVTKDNENYLFPVTSISSAQNKPLYASGGDDRIIYIWNSLTKKKVFSSRNYENPISNLIFSENGKSLIFTSSYLFDDRFSTVPDKFFTNEAVNDDLNFSFNNQANEKPDKEVEDENDEINLKLKRGEIQIDDIDKDTNEIVNRLYILNLK